MTTSKKTRFVSVPFRGSCSEIRSFQEEGCRLTKVSVPFRGSCSEIRIAKPFMTGTEFPSPFGVHVLKWLLSPS